MITTDWHGRRVVVVGAGRSGIATARLLTALGAHAVLTDRHPETRLPAATAAAADAGFELALGGHPAELWADTDIVVVSPGIPPQAPPVVAAGRHGLPTTSEIEFAASLARAPAVAITGSNGKSTVTTMVGEILRASGLDVAVCGNIGTPYSAVVLEELRGSSRFDRVVLEMSSFQCQSIERFRPHWAAILNISPDHLDWHRDFEEYAEAKLRLVHNCTEDDWLVFGADDPPLMQRLGQTRARQVPFGSRRPSAGSGPAAWEEEGGIQWRDADGTVSPILPSSEIGTLGRHNVGNACAAVALSMLAGATAAAAALALREFSELEHRMERCGSPRGILCVNDSKATNVDATVAALSGFERGVWLILGGRDKKGDFNKLRPLLQDRVRRVLLIGEAAGRIAASLHGAAALERCGTMNAAIDRSIAAAAPGDVLLLSPACTSFDQYDDFEHRGRDFKAHVARHDEGAGNAGKRG